MFYQRYKEGDYSYRISIGKFVASGVVTEMISDSDSPTEADRMIRSS